MVSINGNHVPPANACVSRTRHPPGLTSCSLGHCQPPGPGAGPRDCPPLQRRAQATGFLMTSRKAEAPRPLLGSDSSLRQLTELRGALVLSLPVYREGCTWGRDASGAGGGQGTELPHARGHCLPGGRDCSAVPSPLKPRLGFLRRLSSVPRILTPRPSQAHGLVCFLGLQVITATSVWWPLV